MICALLRSWGRRLWANDGILLAALITASALINGVLAILFLAFLEALELLTSAAADEEMRKICHRSDAFDDQRVIHAMSPWRSPTPAGHVDQDGS